MTSGTFVHTKRFIVRVRAGRYGETSYPRAKSVQERIFGSGISHKVRTGQTLDGTPIYRTTHPAVTMTAHEVLALLQRELRRDGVDRVTILVV